MDNSVIENKYYANNGRLLHNVVDSIVFTFGGIYQKDHDDFYSLANEVFTDVLKRYDGVQDFHTFLKSCLKNKIKSQITNRNRIKRTCDRTSISIETPIGSEDFTVGDTVVSNFDINKEISEELGLTENGYVEKYLNSLPKKAKEIIQMKMSGFCMEQIMKELELTKGEYDNYMKAARMNENLELFTKSSNYKEDNRMCEIMPIDTTDNYRMDKYSLGSLLDEKKDGDINCKYILQRKAFQWTDEQKNKFLTRILNNQPIPEIVICEQYVNGKKKRHLIDGLQRLSYAGLYRAKGITVGLDGAEFYEIKYDERVYDEKGDPVFDEDGDVKKETKVFNVIGKKFDELPKFLQDRFNRFNINVTTYFDCTDEMIAYHIRNYNNHEGMTKNQYEITNIDTDMAKMIKDISCEHPFFKDRVGTYTEKNEIKGILERIVVESIITMNFLDDWKKKPEDAYEFVNDNGSKDLFDDFKETLDRLCNIVSKNNKKLFNTTNSSTWFAVFSKFKTLGLSDNKFAEFMDYFTELLDTFKIDGKSFVDTYRNRNTKDKPVITAKINGIITLMLDYLHIEEETHDDLQIENEELKKYVEDFNNSELVKICGVKGTDRSLISMQSLMMVCGEDKLSDNDVAGFINGTSYTKEEIEDTLLYLESLNDWSVNVDSESPILKLENIPALINVVKYAYDNDFDENESIDWFVKLSKSSYAGQVYSSKVEMLNKLIGSLKHHVDKEKKIA